MKICDYCGKVNDDSMPSCVGCGTDLAAQTENPASSALEQNKQPRVLNARIATIILLAYVATQLFSGAVSGVAAGVISNIYGIQNLRQIYAISGVLGPATMILGTLLGAAVTILLTRQLIPTSIKDSSPNGAAWILGHWKAIRAASVVGLVVGICAVFFCILTRPHSTYDDLGPVERMALTPGLPQITVFITAVLFAPSAEEMLFRGVLYGGYRKSFGPVLAAILTTGLFVAAHIPEYVHFPLGLIAVAVEPLAALWCRLRWGAIGPAIAVHTVFNLISVLTIVAGKIWH